MSQTTEDAMGEGQSKLQQLGSVLKTIQDQLGRSAVSLFGSDETEAAIVGIPTGDKGLDQLFAGIGLPRQRITEIFGNPAVGKSALAFSLLAATQKAGGVAAYIDVDHGFDAQRARALGVDLELLVLAQPSTAEEALYIAEELVRSSAVDLVALDSVAALVPEAELEGKVGEAPPGLQARLMGQALRRLTVALRRSQTALLLVNHLRPGMDGRPSTTPGGSALPFFAAVRLEIECLPSPLGAESLTLGVTVIKSKLGPSGKGARVTLLAA